MLGFLYQKKRMEVRRLMQGYMNRNYGKQFRYGKRTDPRANYSEVVWVVPCESSSHKPQFGRAYPAVTKDTSSEGMALLQTGPFELERVLVGLPGDDATPTKFLDCRHTHSTALGYGYYQVGLHPECLARVDASQMAEIERALEQYQDPAAAPGH
jgi:hypothetical protein